MKIRSHSESHIVELEDGSRWQMFPGDVDVTLDWQPETDLTLLPGEDEVSSHILVSESARFASSPLDSLGLRAWSNPC